MGRVESAAGCGRVVASLRRCGVVSVCGRPVWVVEARWLTGQTLRTAGLIMGLEAARRHVEWQYAPGAVRWVRPWRLEVVRARRRLAYNLWGRWRRSSRW